jgi:hypothetical protein
MTDETTGCEFRVPDDQPFLIEEAVRQALRAARVDGSDLDDIAAALITEIYLWEQLGDDYGRAPYEPVDWYREYGPVDLHEPHRYKPHYEAKNPFTGETIVLPVAEWDHLVRQGLTMVGELCTRCPIPPPPPVAPPTCTCTWVADVYDQCHYCAIEEDDEEDDPPF